MKNKQDRGSVSAWLIRNFSKEERRDIVEFGCSSGFHHLTYYSDTVKLYRRFEEEIWDSLFEDADAYGNVSILQFIASLNGAEDVGDETQLKNLLVWYIVEKTAYRLTEEEA